MSETKHIWPVTLTRAGDTASSAEMEEVFSSWIEDGALTHFRMQTLLMKTCANVREYADSHPFSFARVAEAMLARAEEHGIIELVDGKWQKVKTDA